MNTDPNHRIFNNPKATSEHPYVVRPIHELRLRIDDPYYWMVSGAGLHSYESQVVNGYWVDQFMIKKNENYIAPKPKSKTKKPLIYITSFILAVAIVAAFMSAVVIICK